MGTLIAVLALLVIFFTILLTYLGNGYEVIRAKKAVKTNGKSKGSPILAEAVLGGVLVFLTLAAPWIGLVTVFAYGLLALMRGGNFIYWGVKLRKGTDVSEFIRPYAPGRFFTFGIVLVVLTVFMWIASVGVLVSFSDFASYRDRAYTAELKAEARNAYTAAIAYIEAHPGERVDTAEKLLKTGYAPALNIEIVLVNVSKSGGEIRLRHKRLKDMEKPHEAVIRNLDEGPKLMENSAASGVS